MAEHMNLIMPTEQQILSDRVEGEEQVAIMTLLREATRLPTASAANLRRLLCTERLLPVLRRMLQSDDDRIQVDAAATMVNLSLEHGDYFYFNPKTGVLSALVEVLRGGHPEARHYAARAMYILAAGGITNHLGIEEAGAIPPLLKLFAGSRIGYPTRFEAGMALYHLCKFYDFGTKIADEPAAVRMLLATAETWNNANEADAARLRLMALIILAYLADFPKGRTALLNGGAVEAIVNLMGDDLIIIAPGSAEEECCITTLYRMSLQGRPRFRRVARRAGVEAALRPVAYSDDDGWVRRDMARLVIRAIREENNDPKITAAAINVRLLHHTTRMSDFWDPQVDYSFATPNPEWILNQVSPHQLVMEPIVVTVDEIMSVADVRQLTPDAIEERRQRCTRRLLAVLRTMLLSGEAAIQTDATAAVANLSLGPRNRKWLVRCGVVPSLVEGLRGGHPEARDHAARAMCILAMGSDSYNYIDNAGAMTPLLEMFANDPDVNIDYRTRFVAGMALCYLFDDIFKRIWITRTPGVVQKLLAMAQTQDEDNEVDAARVRRLAMIILAHLADCVDGREALMDGDAVAAIVALMDGAAMAPIAPPGSAEEECCIITLYFMNRSGLRFGDLARAAGVEDALQQVGHNNTDKAQLVLRAIRWKRDIDGREPSDAILYERLGYIRAEYETEVHITPPELLG